MPAKADREIQIVKIQEMGITPIAISDPPLRNAAGLRPPFALRIILEITSDSGITGVSEIPGSGLTRRNDEVEMRKIEPGRHFKPVRW